MLPNPNPNPNPNPATKLGSVSSAKLHEKFFAIKSTFFGE